VRKVRGEVFGKGVEVGRYEGPAGREGTKERAGGGGADAASSLDCCDASSEVACDLTLRKNEAAERRVGFFSDDEEWGAERVAVRLRG